MTDMETALKEIMDIDGAIGVALVDHTSGMALGTLGGGKDLDLNVAAAGNTDVVRAKLRAMEMLNLSEKIEDILISLDTQYHMIRPLTSRAGKGLFLYLALRRDRANLAMARHRLRQIEADLDVSQDRRVEHYGCSPARDTPIALHSLVHRAPRPARRAGRVGLCVRSLARRDNSPASHFEVALPSPTGPSPGRCSRGGLGIGSCPMCTSLPTPTMLTITGCGAKRPR